MSSGIDGRAVSERMASVRGCAGVTGLLSAPVKASKPSAENAIQALNAWRAEAGMAGLSTHDTVMSEGCRLHNAYLSANTDVRGLDQHAERPDRPRYTELGAAAGRRSNLWWPGVGLPGPPDGLWYDAVYHRMSLLDPRATTGWFDASSGRACMGVDGDAPAPSLTFYPWPANGGEDVPVAFTSHEYPDPYEMVPRSVKQLGFPVSVNVNGPWESMSDGARVEHASLTRDGGGSIPVTALDRTKEVSGYLDMTVAAKLYRGRARVTVSVPDTGVPRKLRIYVAINDPTCCWRQSHRKRVVAVRSSRTVTFSIKPPAVREIEVWAGVRKQRVGAMTYGGTHVEEYARRR
jgi:hypothetical protein